MRLGVRIAVVVLVLAAAAAGDTFEDLSERLRSEPFELTADSLHYDMERELYIGRGNVTVRQSGRTLRADWVAFNRLTGAGLAIGHVELVDGGDVLQANFVEFDLETIEGVMHEGTLESASTAFRAKAAEIAKTGPRTYSFREGEFTTCRCPDAEDADPWVLHSEQADLEIEGYAKARNTTVEVFGVPVAWIPWMIFPVMTQRQTGFLFPEFSLSSISGFEFGLPFFWAPRDDVGLVLTPRYSVERGFGSAGRFEFVQGARSEGKLLGAYYHDEKIDPNSADEPFGRDRWSASGNGDVELPAGLRFQTDYRFASDNEVPFDFQELRENRSDRFLLSQGMLSRTSFGLGRLGTSVGATFADDLQSPDNLDRDRFLLQRWPTARVDWLAGAISGAPWLAPSLETEYTWFQARGSALGDRPSSVVGEHGLFLDTGVDALPDPLEPGPQPDPHRDDFATFGGSEGDGRFEEGEPLSDRGHRLLLYPKLAVPLAWRGISLLPEVGWYQTLYDTQVRDFRQRGFATARVDLMTRLRGRFGDIVHVLEPRAGYALAYTYDQGGNPLFVPPTASPLERIRALDLDAVTDDDADRIPRANRVTAGFDNRIYRKPEAGGSELLADFRLLSLYDIEEQSLSSLLVDGHAYPSDSLDLRFHLDFDPDRARVDEGLAEVRWSHPRGVALDAGYRWSREIPLTFESFLEAGSRYDERVTVDHINQLRGGASLDLTAQWSLRYGFAYSIEGNQLLANQGRVEYLSRCGCWALGVELSQDRASGINARLVYRLVGLGGEPARPRPSLLDGFGALW
jgi:lipopolysaccharide assembly outer membrane protein LptD (OstA)